MKELVENIEKQITTDKEVISVLPRNGIKAIKTLLKTIDETTEKYENLNEKLLKEIESRYAKLTEVEENTEIPQIEQEILKYDIAEKNTDTRSSFEKMGLDRVVYNVNGYYKSNLERLNKELVFSVKQFEKLSPEVKEFVRSPGQLKEMAMMDSDVVHSVTKGQFFKQIEIIQKRAEENKRMLPESKKIIHMLANIGTDVNKLLN